MNDIQKSKYYKLILEKYSKNYKKNQVIECLINVVEKYSKNSNIEFILKSIYNDCSVFFSKKYKISEINISEEKMNERLENCMENNLNSMSEILENFKEYSKPGSLL